MKGVCNKCGYEGEMHKVGRYFPDGVKFQIEQCPECCFIMELFIDRGLKP
jgi:hypothetical protein